MMGSIALNGTYAYLAVAISSFFIISTCRFYYDRYNFRKWAIQNGCALPPLIPNSIPFNYFHKVRVARDKSDALDSIMRKKYEKYGPTHAICGYFTGDIKVLSTMEAQNIRAVLTRPDIFHRPETHLRSIAPFLSFGVFTLSGAAWKNVRDLMRPEFTTKKLQDLAAFEKHITAMFSAIPEAGKDGWTDDFSLLELLHFFTLDTTTELLFGSSVDSQHAAMKEKRLDIGDNAHKGSKYGKDDSLSPTKVATAFDCANEWISMRMRLGTAYWVWDSLEFRKACKTVHNFTDQFVTQALAAAAQRRKRAFTAFETTAHPTGLIDSFADFSQSHTDLRFQTLHVLVAARDTTAAMISWALNRLLRNSASLSRLRSEIICHFGTELNPLQPLTFATLKSCKYLQWVLLETNRLHPAGPLNAREAKKDTILPIGGGVDGRSPIAIRRGTQVKFVNYLTHRDEAYWGPDAWDFRPERWEEKKYGWEYTPFGGGARVCPGQQYGLTEGGFVLVRLLQRFDCMESVTPAEKMDEKLYKTIIVPKDGLRMRLHRAEVATQTEK